MESSVETPKTLEHMIATREEAVAGNERLAAVRVRNWIRAAANGGTPENQAYRMMTPAWDFDEDLQAFAACFREEKGTYWREEACYDLRMLWRVALRRYAFAAANAIGRELREHEVWYWKLWRKKAYALPRLAVGIFAGFILLWSSGGLTDFIWRAHFDRWAPAWVSLLSATAVVYLASADVQRRVGRAGWRKLALRTFAVLGIGIAHTAIGFTAMAVAGPWFQYDTAPSILIPCCALALLLGFVFQLFWDESSMGDPL